MGVLVVVVVVVVLKCTEVLHFVFYLCTSALFFSMFSTYNYRLFSDRIITWRTRNQHQHASQPYPHISATSTS